MNSLSDGIPTLNRSSAKHKIPGNWLRWKANLQDSNRECMLFGIDRSQQRPQAWLVFREKETQQFFQQVKLGVQNNSCKV